MTSDQNKKKKIPAKYLRLYKQFKIFYKNPYGKIGFLILIGFVIFTLLTPLIIIEPNYSALAPILDTSSPKIEYKTSLTSTTNVSLGNSSLYLIPTSDTSSVGANQLLLSSKSGSLYSFCINSPNPLINNRLYSVYSQNSSNISTSQKPIIATLQNCYYLEIGRVKLTNFVFLPYSDGHIVVGKIGQTSISPYQPIFNPLYNITYNGTLTSRLIVNSLPYRYFLYNNPSYDYNDGAGDAFAGQLYFITTNNGKSILHDYSILPETNLWNHTLSLSGKIGESFLGSGFGLNNYNNHSEVIVYNESSICAYNSVTGKPLWRENSGLSLNVSIGVNIPCGQERIYNGKNYGFFVNDSSSVQMINLVNGKISDIYSSKYKIESLSESEGVSAFPRGVLITTQNSFVILHLTSKNKVSNTTTLIPTGVGFVEDKGVFTGADNMAYTTSNGYVISLNVSATSPSNTFFWSIKLPSNKVSSLPDIILNGESGNLQLGVISSSNQMYLISAIAVDLNPITPRLTSPTGESFPLGTEYKGYNVWSEFVTSFYVDWEFGIILGLYTMGLALLVGMYVGYKGGISSSIIETVALGIYLTPSLGLLIALTDFFPANQRFMDIILVIGGLGWPFAAFTLMGIVKTVKNRTYIDASKMMGAHTFTILRKDVLPNLGPLMLYMLSLSIAGGAGAVSALQFLGIARITLPTWGGMLSEVLSNFYYPLTSPSWIYPPVIALTLFVVSFIFISRGMDELSNPRLRRR